MTQQDTILTAATAEPLVADEADTLSLLSGSCYIAAPPMADTTGGAADNGVGLPQYYREGFLAGNAFVTTEGATRTYGIAGDPLPYQLRSDNLVTLLLIGCFVLFVPLLTRSRRFITQHLKHFFDMPFDNEPLIATPSELRLQASLVLLTSVLLAVFARQWAAVNISENHILDTEFQYVLLLLAVFVVYFILKHLTYALVNAVFFDARRNTLWQHSLLFSEALEGVLIFPGIMLMVYFDISEQNIAYYLLFVLFIIKISAFYKLWIIFFRRNVVYLQIFLYFCALELIPMLGIAVSLWAMMNELKVNI